MKLGIWPAKYALGEKVRAASMCIDGYDEDTIKERLREYVDNNWVNDMASYQVRGEKAAKIWYANGEGTGDSRNNALFGTPIDRSKENTDRMHAITLSMGADTGKRDHAPGSYNANIVSMYALKNADGTYVTWAGGRTTDKDAAHTFYTRAEAIAARKGNQYPVEI